MTITKGNTTQLATINENNSINIMFIEEGKTIKKVGSGSNKVDNIDIINTNSIGSIKISKLAKFKNFM